MKYFLLSFFQILFFASIFTFSFAQSGKITGRIVDGSVNEGIPFVNVLVEGTSTGAASDINGEYFILNIPPGIYSIRASAIGYNTMTVQNVNVSSGLTTRVDFTLMPATLELSENVIVTADRPLVTRDLTSTTAIIGADEIASLPITEFQEILQLKAGYVGGNVRGGRSGEVVYAIDGVPVTDVYDGSTVVDVNANSIQELQFVSGAFNAEFGKALSGYVNIATKDGDNEFTGNFTSYIGDYFSTNTAIFRGIDDINPVSIRNFEGSFSGPILKNSLYFYINARYIHFGGWLNGKRVFNPWDITVNRGATLPVEERYDIDSTGDGSLVPMNWNEKIYGQGKLTYRPFNNLKINYNYILDDVEYRDYDHSFSFNPDGDFKKFRSGNTNILGLTHTLSATTFYQANFSYFFKKFHQYVYKDVNDPRWTHDLLMGQQPSEIPSFRTGGTQSSSFRRTTNTYGAKLDITSQVSKTHLVKGGIDFNQHTLSFNNINLLQEIGLPDPSQSGYPYAVKRIPDINDPNENLNIDMYIRKPIEFSAYLQDKVELSEMIINLGIRFDYFIPDGSVLNDPTDPDIYRPRKLENIYVGDTNGDGQLGEGDLEKSVAERKSYWYQKSGSSAKISPRLGVAFPITDRGVIHFSYGHFFQTPNFELLYRNPEYKFGQGTGNLGIAGNPSLKPQMTISAEVGVQQAIADNLTIDLTGYFRDISNLAGTRADEIRLFGGSASYSQFVNSDFGFVKGIVFTVTKQFSDNWSATIDYTLQSAKGNASDPAATRNQLAGGELPEIQLIKLNWDQTHTLNGTFTYTSRDMWGFSFIGQYGSGFPYTPTQSINVSSLLINSELKPSFMNLDMRAYKDFRIGTFRLSLFARIYNLLDIANQLNVYNDSGTADFTIDEFLRRSDDNPDRLVNTLDEYYRIPTFYSEPRRVEVGATIFF
jgi:outer membrane receptor protein involved in Fe transport